MSYCSAVRNAAPDDVHRIYHDTEYGFPLRNDDALFGRLILEINQAGLSWTTILRKKEAFHAAYDNFAVDRVARYDDGDRERLLADAGIIRNRLKVNAAIENANRILALREHHGSFAEWLDAHHPLTRDEWRKLFKRTFVFTGGEIVNEFLLSTGYLPGAHDEDCAVHQRILREAPPWKSGVAR